MPGTQGNDDLPNIHDHADAMHNVSKPRHNPMYSPDEYNASQGLSPSSSYREPVQTVQRRIMGGGTPATVAPDTYGAKLRKQESQIGNYLGGIVKGYKTFTGQ